MNRYSQQAGHMKYTILPWNMNAPSWISLTSRHLSKLNWSKIKNLNWLEWQLQAVPCIVIITGMTQTVWFLFMFPHAFCTAGVVHSMCVGVSIQKCARFKLKMVSKCWKLVNLWIGLQKQFTLRPTNRQAVQSILQ